MTKQDLTVNNTELTNYITIKGQQVPCTREQYLSIKRPGRKEAMRKYRNEKDGIETVSLDAFPTDESKAFAASNNTEEEAVLKATLNLMFKELEDKPPMRKRILELLAQEYTQREIASILGIADGTLTWHIKKLREDLAKFR